MSKGYTREMNTMTRVLSNIGYAAMVILGICVGIHFCFDTVVKFDRQMWLWNAVAPDMDMYFLLDPLLDVLVLVGLAGVIAAAGCTAIWALTLPFSKKVEK